MTRWALFEYGVQQYETDKLDALWLARSLLGECGRWGRKRSYEAVAFCMLQRFIRWPERHRRWATFRSFIRAFSQPVNPRWAQGGDLAVKYQGKPIASPGRLRRRAKIQKMPWHRIPKRVRRATLNVLTGLVDSPVPDAVNFGARGLVKRQGRTGVTIGGNTFFGPEQDKTVRWIDGELQIWV